MQIWALDSYKSAVGLLDADPYVAMGGAVGAQVAVEQLVVGLPNEEGLGVVGAAAVTLDGLELGRDRPLTAEEGGLDEF